MSICCCGAIYYFIELGGRKSAVGRGCSSGAIKREGREEKKGKRTENHDLFLFPMCFLPHMVLVLAYIPRISELTRDPAPQTNMILAVSLWAQFDPAFTRGQRSPPGSSKLTQCVKAGMTPCSAELCRLNILLISTCMHLMLSRLLSCLFFMCVWVILNSPSLQSLWCVTNSPPTPSPPSPLPHPLLHGSPFSPILCLFFFFAIFFHFFRAGPLLVIFPPSPSLSAQKLFSLSVSVPAVKDVSVQLSQIMFACPAVKTGGCPFHSTSHPTKGDGREEGFNARVWTQAIIPNYCFSFQFPCPDGGPTGRTCNNPLQSSRISGPPESGPRSWDSVAFISMWVRSWFKPGVMGELTPGTQLSMGSAQRLYVLMAGLFIRTGLSKLQLLNQGTGASPSRLRSVNPTPRPPRPPSCSQNYGVHDFGARGLPSDCRLGVCIICAGLKIPMTAAEPFGGFQALFFFFFKCTWSPVKYCYRRWAHGKHQRRRRDLQLNWIVLEIVISRSLKMTSSVVLAGF